MKFELEKLIRKNIQRLKPYSSARHEFTGEASVFLDANENSYGSPLQERYNRYPDPLQWKLKQKLSKIKNVPSENIFIGNGSDEVIDLGLRIFCEPVIDNVIICPPTYGMYEVSANINDIVVKKINLTEHFQLDIPQILQGTDHHTKLLFICSPNNPTGNNMIGSGIEELLEKFQGIIIIDEAYINYSNQRSFIDKLPQYPNLIIIQTLSKAWGLAALRLGLCFASTEIIDLFNKVKPPYNVNESSQKLALEALENDRQVTHWVKEIIAQRELIASELLQFPFIKKIYPSDANFLLIEVDNVYSLYQYLAKNKIIIRNRSHDVLCENCVRITVGTAEENILLLEALKKYNA